MTFVTNFISGVFLIAGMILPGFIQALTIHWRSEGIFVEDRKMGPFLYKAVRTWAIKEKKITMLCCCGCRKSG